MRFSIAAAASLLLAPLAVGAAPQRGGSAAPPDRKEAVADDGPKPTEFNGLSVPPITQLTASNFRETIAHGYWMVKAYSPYCHHCNSLAPKWQTMYEFYYTSDPVPASSEPQDAQTNLNSFTNFYDFRFAELDCIAYQDICVEIEATAWPALVLFKDGKSVKKYTGDKSMEKLSGVLEESLETIKPGSRPTDGIKLPKVGASSVEGFDANKSKPPGPPKDYSKAPTEKSIANPQGKSEELDPESFQARVKKTVDPWFIKFYAPWCHHCQAMAPSWKSMAREMSGQVNIGEVNCEVHKKLCSSVGVRGFPTIKFFKGPEVFEYNGLRGIGDLVDWASQASKAASGVQEVTLKEFEVMEQTEEVIFVYFYDHATTSEDFMALERLPVHTIGHGRIVKTNDPDMIKRFRISTWPRLLVSRDGQVSVFPKLMPQQMRDVPALADWMKANWLPLVPELTAANSKEIMSGHYAVLGVLNRERGDEFTSAKREIKEAAIEWMDKQEQAFKLERQELRDAKQLRIEEAEDRKDQNALRDAKLIRINMDEIQRKAVAFAWVDGVFWERWIRETFGISVHDGEKVIMYDYDNHRYWDVTSTGNPIVPSRTSILETLPKIVVSPPKLSAKITGSSISHFFWRIKHAFTSHPILATGIVIGAIISYFMGMRYLRRRRSYGHTNGYFQVDGKEALLGIPTANGKAD